MFYIVKPRVVKGRILNPLEKESDISRSQFNSGQSEEACCSRRCSVEREGKFEENCFDSNEKQTNRFQNRVVLSD